MVYLFSVTIGERKLKEFLAHHLCLGPKRIVYVLHSPSHHSMLLRGDTHCFYVLKSFIFKANPVITLAKPFKVTET